MLILLNKYSNNGKGLQKWEKFKSEIEEKYIGRHYSLVSDFAGLNDSLRGEFMRGERTFIAAGGDGTINFLLNQIMQMKAGDREQLVMGAIGLGSSNDFHKPFSEDNFISDKVPLKLNHKKAAEHNVGQVDFEDENGDWQRKYFIINCGLGVVAQANYLFNSKDRIVRRLKSKWVMGTIWYAALKTLLAAQNIPARIMIGNEIYKTDVTNLSVIINPHVSGNFCYDFKVSANSDYLGVALCERMGISSRLRTFLSLTRGKFVGLPKTRAWRTSRIEIYPNSSTPLELDGEVYLARSIRIKLLRGVLKVSQ
jgi:diacylglycerol kinase (ATP)